MLCSQPRTHLFELTVYGVSLHLLVTCQSCQSVFAFITTLCRIMPRIRTESFMSPTCCCPAAKPLAVVAISLTNLRLSHVSVWIDGFVFFVLMQRGVYDFVALSLGLAASVRPASDILTSGRPPQVLCTLKNYILLLLTMLISFAMYWGCLAWLTTRPWFKISNGTSLEVRRCITPSHACRCTALRDSACLCVMPSWSVCQ